MKGALAGSMAALVVASCTALAPSDSDSRPTAGVLRLVVENHQWHDLDIYAAGGIGAPLLVGLVPGRSIRTFELSHAWFAGAEELRLIADPHGSTQRFVSEPMAVDHQSARWQLKRSGTHRLFSR